MKYLISLRLKCAPVKSLVYRYKNRDIPIPHLKNGGEGLNGGGMHLVQVERPSIVPPRWSHRLPLLCVSSLGCLCGDGHRSSSAGLNILFTSTLLERRAYIRQESPSNPPPPCTLSFACFTFVWAWWKWHSPFSLDLLRVEGKHLRRRKYLEAHN